MRFRTALGAKLARECRRDINQTIRRQQQNQTKYETTQPDEIGFNEAEVYGFGCIPIILLILFVWSKM